jgi:hypothetical protein
MPSEAAKQVKFGFWIAAGFWLFMIIVCVFLMLAVKALGNP